MYLRLNGTNTKCFIERIYTLRINELHHLLANPDTPNNFDRDLMYKDGIGLQHCIMAMNDTPGLRPVDMALIYAQKKIGKIQVVRLSAEDFAVNTGYIELDQLSIKLLAITEFLVQRRERIIKSIDCVVRYSEINRLYGLDFKENKHLALLVGEMVQNQYPKCYSDLGSDSIAFIIDDE